MISRRIFLLGVSTAALFANAPAFAKLRHGSTLVATGHKAQVNLQVLAPTTYGMDYPFIDCAKMMTAWTLFGSGVTTDIYSHVNSDGFPTGFPTGGGAWRSQTAIYYSGTNWVLDWDSSITIDLNGGGGAGQPGFSTSRKSAVLRTAKPTA